MGVYIAMWSGPRNISTALMRSFENRSDTAVLDEPFYAHYLEKTGINHPGKEKIILSQSTDWDRVAKMCVGEIPGNKPIWYQKHMAQHNLEDCDLSWIHNVINCLLIRDPKFVIPSYGKRFKIDDEYLLGFVQQLELLNIIEQETGQIPPIIDSQDILKNPRCALKKLCEKIGIPYLDTMLQWESGKRESDGVWAPYWYNEVERSTGFKPYVKKDLVIEKSLISIYKKCKAHYNILWEKRIRI